MDPLYARIKLADGLIEVHFKGRHVSPHYAPESRRLASRVSEALANWLPPSSILVEPLNRFSRRNTITEWQPVVTSSMNSRHMTCRAVFEYERMELTVFIHNFEPLVVVGFFDNDDDWLRLQLKVLDGYSVKHEGVASSGSVMLVHHNSCANRRYKFFGCLGMCCDYPDFEVVQMTQWVDSETKR